MPAGAARLGPAATLIAARRRCGLTQEQLAEQAGLSVRAIRGWESGSTRAPRRASLDVLVGALGLDAEAAEAFKESWTTPRERRSFAELIESRGDVEAYLADRADRAALDYRDLVVLDRWVIGPQRRLSGKEDTVVMTALQDGVDNRLIAWGDAPDQDVHLVGFEPVSGCRVSGQIVIDELGLAMFDISLGRTLLAGDTHVFSYRWDLSEVFRGHAGAQTTDAIHGFRRGVDRFVLQVEFAGCRPPDRAWHVTGNGEDRRIVRSLDVGADSELHIVCDNIEAGVHGIVWEW